MSHGTPPLRAITLLRNEADDVRTRAYNAERLADEAWGDYCRKSDVARTLWRNHADLLAGLALIEAGEARV